jgi:xanthine dehydrogenase accessory factor
LDLFERLREHIESERPVSLATIVAGPEMVGFKIIVHPDGQIEGDLGVPHIMDEATQDAVELLRLGQSDFRRYERGEKEYEIFFDSFPVMPAIIIVGAVQTAQSLSRLSKELGYKVVVTDARAAFATPERFPEADAVLKGWPQDVLPELRLDEATYVVLLSHDPKFDEPTLDCVLPSKVQYVGAIGSRRTQETRRERLRSKGFTLQQIQKIHGPVGLDLGGRSAAETALAILAEITAVRYGKSGGMLGREYNREEPA